MAWGRIASASYWACFVATFLIIAAWESRRPRRSLSGPVERRWANHGLLLLITAVVTTVLLRTTPVLFAATVAGSRFGVLNKPWLPLAVRCAITVLALDFLQYWIHWSFHRFGWLWRVHQVHHSDPDYDVSIAGRFHPLEVLWEQVVRFGAIALLAPPVAGVFAAELLAAILNVSVHANASLPEWAERMVGAVFVTPDFHRIHHSRDIGDQHHNLGQTFSWWDRWFGSQTPSLDREQTYKTGLEGLEQSDCASVAFMLSEPFRAVPIGDARSASDSAG